MLVDPDVSEVALGAEDEFLVMATDGLWDVISSQDVVTLARNNLKKGLSPQVRFRGGAAGLGAAGTWLPWV